MSRVITFSRQFPAKHPRKGEDTNFIVKIWQSLYSLGLDFTGPSILSNEALPVEFGTFCNPNHSITPKHTTIRAGNRWKVGDKFSPRVWSGKPYQSKMITIAPDIEIKKVWEFQVSKMCLRDNGFIIDNDRVLPFHKSNKMLQDISRNDGLLTEDFISWFSIHPKAKDLSFQGQILCWNDKINY